MILCPMAIGYIKCDFGADFSQKLQIPILSYSIKMGMKYQIKQFLSLILVLQGSSQVLDIIHLYIMFQNSSLTFLLIFVKNCTAKI